MLAAADEHVRLQADLAQLGDALLRRLGFQFSRRLDERHECDMHDEHVLRPRLERELPDRLQKRQPLDVTGRPADLGDDDVSRLLLLQPPDVRLDLVGDVRDHLHGLAEVIAAPFLVQHGLVNLPAGNVVRLREHAVCKTLVVPEVEVGLRTVVENVHLAVLKRVHRAGIDV